MGESVAPTAVQRYDLVWDPGFTVEYRISVAISVTTFANGMVMSDKPELNANRDPKQTIKTPFSTRVAAVFVMRIAEVIANFGTPFLVHWITRPYGGFILAFVKFCVMFYRQREHAFMCM